METRPGGFGRLATVAVFLGGLAALIAGATIWLLLADPVAVAIAIEGGEVSPLVRQLAELLYAALAGLFGYL
jgi:hypothetical protein